MGYNINNQTNQIFNCSEYSGKYRELGQKYHYRITITGKPERFIFIRTY